MEFLKYPYINYWPYPVAKIVRNSETAAAIGAVILLAIMKLVRRAA
jgi:hypothetical protein